MRAFPIFLRTTGRGVIITGDGEEAAQNRRLILKPDAQITLLADRPGTELAALAGRLREMTSQHIPRSHRRAFWQDVFTGPVWQMYERRDERRVV